MENSENKKDVSINCKSYPQYTAFDKRITEWMQKYKIPGATLALMKGTKLKYVQGTQ